MKRFFIAVLSVFIAVVLVLTTGFLTYRYIMLNMEIEQDEDCYYVTVFDNTDVYDK